MKYNLHIWQSEDLFCSIFLCLHWVKKIDYWTLRYISPFGFSPLLPLSFLFSVFCIFVLFLYYSDIWRFLYWVCRHLLQWKICLMLFVKKFLKSNHVMLPTGEVAHLSIHISLLIKDGRKTFQDVIAILVNFLSWRFQLFQ